MGLVQTLCISQLLLHRSSFTKPSPLRSATYNFLHNVYPDIYHGSSFSSLQIPIMAGGAIKYRHLNRSSAHRQALLRNLVTSLITHESIKTTWHKAKEAQRLAEKLITLGKKNTNASRRRAEQIFFVRIYIFYHKDTFAYLVDVIRNRSSTSQPSSPPSATATSTAQAATHACSGSNP